MVCQAVVAEIADGVVEELGCRYHCPSQLPLLSEPATKCGSLGADSSVAWM